MFKPSQIWPPPPGNVDNSVHGVINPQMLSGAEAPAITADQPDIQPKFQLGSATAAASGEPEQTIRARGMGGDPFEIMRQIQLYTTNALLKHPLVSPVFAYLGGLPPLFVVASDREVLRDEIIYTLVYLVAFGSKGGHFI
jgi:acetyl esterase/lipase